MSTKEILTLQIGHYSNFVGSHLWNIQESSFTYDPLLADSKHRDINHDVLFREGKNRQGHVTYTPRMIAFDLKGSLNSLKKEGTLYEKSTQEEIQWPGDVTLHQTSTVSSNPYLRDLKKEEEETIHGGNSSETQTIEDVEMKDTSETKPDKSKLPPCEPVFGKKYYDLDDCVNVWSDFLRVHLHPKTIKIVEEYTRGNELHSFDVFGLGEEVAKEYESRQEIEDKIQYFAEECDQLQGFHVLLDTHDGFGGIGSSVLQYLEDEYGSKGIMTFGFTPSNLKDDTPRLRADRIINSALTYVKCANHSSLFFPLSMAQSLWMTIGPTVSFPHLQFKNIDYHTSALLGASLETATLPWRKSQSIHIRDITDSFSSLGKKIGSLSTSLPFPMKMDNTLISCLQSTEKELPWQSLTPHSSNSISPLMQSVVLRGINSNISSPLGSTQSSAYHTCMNTEEILQMYLAEKFSSVTSGSCVSVEPSHVSTPYPHLFKKNVSKYGLLSDNLRHEYEGVESIPMMTSMQSTEDVRNLLAALYTSASKLNIKKHSRFLEAGLEEDDFISTIHDLRTLENCYDCKEDMG